MLKFFVMQHVARPDLFLQGRGRSGELPALFKTNEDAEQFRQMYAQVRDDWRVVEYEANVVSAPPTAEAIQRIMSGGRS